MPYFSMSEVAWEQLLREEVHGFQILKQVKPIELDKELLREPDAHLGIYRKREGQFKNALNQVMRSRY